MELTAIEINRLLDLRIRDAANRRHADSLQDHLDRVKKDRPKLLRSLGLHPFPASTDLFPIITGTILREGYRIEKLAYCSRPGFPVTAHLYLPDLHVPVPAIVRPHGPWLGKKSEPIVQASAIGLVLSGYAVLVIDAPGDSGEPTDLNERGDLGDRNDPWLAMGSPMEGFYVWDIMRGIDYLSTRPEIAPEKIAISGESSGGMAAMLAFAVDERLKACALVCFGSSLESQPHPKNLYNCLPGILAIGDTSDVLALRAPAPILLIGASEDLEFPPAGIHRTFDKLSAVYKRFDRSVHPRLEMIEGLQDYNRRMREAVLAFFDEHLKHRERRNHRAEPRPITDGLHNPCPAETVPVDTDDLRVLPLEQRTDDSMRMVLERNLDWEGSLPFEPDLRLVPWAKYGRINLSTSSTTLTLVDQELNLPALDLDVCINLGLGIFEVYAQILHIMLPGGIEGWEHSTLGPTGDIVSTLIGSMKALVGSTQNQLSIEYVHASGPVSSMIAKTFQLYRPKVNIAVSHRLQGWQDLYRTSDVALLEPLARYLEWPFPSDFSAEGL